MIQKISVLYEDKDIVVINKPPGLVVHSDGRRKEEDITDWMLTRYPQSATVGEPLKINGSRSIAREIPRPGVVHRLDRETSGVLVLAKNKEAFAALKKQFQGREIEKTYHCFVYGVLKDNEGIINLPIGRSRSDFRKRSAERGARGALREATTYFWVLGRGKDATFVEARPKTGRTHQIRVHFKAMDHPIVCDKLYAPKRPPLLGFKRLALHAYSLTFRNLERILVTVTASHPPDFQSAARELGLVHLPP
ncbi:RluA family pseudouridine synthase [Patescibacteria group bacterium]|nr:MAG: RluA family pseudouridine synthase [Patescibacteria group bacterium]